jgi:ribulose-phosphate 3-epimerase
MISSPKKYIDKFECDQITFHIESCREADAWGIIEAVRKRSKPGIAISPETEINRILPLLDAIDTVLVMSVRPGFGGQEFIPESLDRISKLREIIDRKGLRTKISADGGINDKTAPKVIEAGADSVVIGSFLFKTEDPKSFIERLRNMKSSTPP